MHMMALGVSLMLLMQARAVSSLQPSDGMKMNSQETDTCVRKELILV
jgi:hypothetical protein